MPFPVTDSTASGPDVQRNREPGQQLQLRFFALIDGYGRNPPERALWRELIELALSQTRTFMHCDRPVAAEAVHHVALALYMRANEAGIIEGFSAPLLSADCRLNERTIKACMHVLRELRVIRSSRPSRRRPAVHRMNLGGLDWSAVRARAKSSGGTMPPLKGYVQGLLVPDAAVDPDRTREEQQQPPTPDPDQPDQEERNRCRTEGLIAAIAARARRLGMSYDEKDERRRLAAGEIGVDELQALADKLAEQIRTRRREGRR